MGHYQYDLLGRPLRTERPASSEDPTPVATSGAMPDSRSRRQTRWDA